MNGGVTIVPRPDFAEHDGSIEQKFLFEASAKDLLMDWLEFRLVRDPEYYFGPIISLYYDTPALRFYGEVCNGDYLKTKVRLRWYQAVFPPQQPVANCFLEIKQKFGARRHKRRRPLALHPSCLSGDLFSHPAILASPEAAPELHVIAPGLLVPLLVVEYERFRFIDPHSGSRIALDTRITCSRANSGYLTPRAPVTLAAGVLEVKGALDSLPDCLRPMQRHLRKRSFSKYARCCERLIDSASIRRPA